MQTAAIFFLNIKSISMHPLLWMHVMIDFICIVLSSPCCEQREKSENSKSKYMHRPGIEPAIPCYPACRSNRSAIGTVNDLLL